ncbi:dienelactone hydrolase [Aspergillus lucknowensis]|uniref:Dienelactone hydrolase n=1 Tax=Aspergillus lucknowensis TaxID=176173 RepID=A0ABR4LQV9_9EURO
MASVTVNASSGGFLYSNSRNACLLISAETPDFDNEFMQAWQKEGFSVIYVPYSDDEKEYARRLMSVKGGLGVGDNYGIVAFGDAASFCLDYYLKPNNARRLCALVCYYPTNIPDTRSRYPPSVKILTHLAGDTIDVTTTPAGIGTGERLHIGHRAYTYSDAQPGFAEQDLDEYNRLAADLAFARTRDVLRQAYGQDIDLEQPWESHLQGKFFAMDINDTMNAYVKNLTPNVTYAPTLSGGTGERSLRRFYDQHFLNQLPPSMHLRLLSRTIGSDRVVDELFISFEHTQEIPWLLPGVGPTNRKVELVLVSIVSLRAGKLYSEHVYWDQASVLVQVGLLGPKLVPQGVQGVNRLPVIGRESARRILTEDPEVHEPEYHNRLINGGNKQRRSKAGSNARESQVLSPVPEQLEAEGAPKGKHTGVKNGGQNGNADGGKNGIHEA